MPKFVSDCEVNALAFKNSPDDKLTLAVGSLIYQKQNNVKILKLLPPSEIAAGSNLGANRSDQ